MDWNAKVDLFERLRREHEFGVGTVAGVAAKFGVHRRLVRQALAGALPPVHRYPARAKPKLDAVLAFIDTVLDEDQRAPRKQRHTARRIHRRIAKEFADVSVAESTVRNHVRERKRQLGLVRRETFVPQSYVWGQEAQVDWYEAWADLAGERTKLQVFEIRSMASGAAFHRAYLHATQQAFLDAHEQAFDYFGEVFRVLRYDNLASAVRKILRGYRREETVRLMAFRSHWRFAAEFCTPGAGHEKGGIEGEGGYFRRNHWVPVPNAADLDTLNAFLLTCCREDEARVLDGRTVSVGAALTVEREHLMPLAIEGFDLADVVFPLVDKRGVRDGQDQPVFGAAQDGRPGGGAGVCAARGDPACGPAGGASMSAATAGASRCWTWSTTSTCWNVSRVRLPGPSRSSNGARQVGGPPATTRCGIGCEPGTASSRAPGRWWRS